MRQPRRGPTFSESGCPLPKGRRLARWITSRTTPAQSGFEFFIELQRQLSDTFNGTQGPIKFLPRVQQDINDFDPGTKIAISEYNYGGASHISGGIAEADVLGIYGQQGVYAANLCPVIN